MKNKGANELRQLVCRKLDAASELMSAVDGWLKSPEYENEAVLYGALDSWQNIIEEIVSIDKELGAPNEVLGNRLSPEDNEKLKETDEILKRVQSSICSEAEIVRRNMDLYIRQAARIRNGKSGLMTYMKNAAGSAGGRYSAIG
ncbi:MAG: hypothetical protein ACOX7P_00700 [Oscillospiraceae bacterium]|jgi:hypothetical protein